MAAACCLAAAAALPGAVGPGLGVLAVGVVAALVLSGMNSPVVAVVLLLVTMFLKDAVETESLPDVYLFAFAAVLGSAAIAMVRRPDAPQFGPVEVVMALYLLWNIASAFLPHTYPEGEENPACYFIITSTVIPFALYAVGRVAFAGARSVRILLWTVVAVAGYSTLVSIFQFHAPALLWPTYIGTFEDPTQWTERAVGVFNQPVANGFMLVVGFLIILHLVRQPDTSAGGRFVLSLVGVASLYAIYLTYTRVVWLIFGMSMVLGALLLPRVRAVCVTIIAAGLALIVLNWATFASADRSSGGVTSSGEIEDRLNMIATGWSALQEHPVAGWGVTRFALVNTYHHEQWSVSVPWHRGYGIASHVNELGIAVELGLVGLALWLTVLVLVARRLLRAVRSLPPDGVAGRDLAVVGALVFLAWFVCGLTIDLRFLGFINAVVLLLVGLVVGIADRRAIAGEPTGEPAAAGIDQR